MSTNSDVYEIALALLLALFDKFRRHLRRELEVFFKDVLLSLLESATASFEHKWLTMQALARIVKGTRTLAQRN